jgi:hypothetical protein
MQLFSFSFRKIFCLWVWGADHHDARAHDNDDRSSNTIILMKKKIFLVQLVTKRPSSATHTTYTQTRAKYRFILNLVNENTKKKANEQNEINETRNIIFCRHMDIFFSGAPSSRRNVELYLK